MVKTMVIEDVLKLENPIFIDIRAQVEYNEATIDGAINIPLFEDDERAEIGTIYRQIGTDKAKIRGLEIVSQKLPNLVAKFKTLAEERRPLVIFCWRGGMRSESITTILTLMGIECYKLQDGYKGYRKYINSFLEQEELPVKVVVLHGLTGVGKTEVLKELEKIDVGIVDLEGLANNRGSVFGFVGLNNQPSQKMFEGSLVQNILKYEKKKVIITECESRRIGRITLPKLFFENMKSGKHILLYDSLQNRVSRIVRMYTAETKENIEELVKALKMLEKRIGKSRVEEFQKLIENQDFDPVIEYLFLNYYDPLYKYPDSPSNEFDLSVSTDDVFKATEEIKNYILETF